MATGGRDSANEPESWAQRADDFWAHFSADLGDATSTRSSASVDSCVDLDWSDDWSNSGWTTETHFTGSELGASSNQPVATGDTDVADAAEVSHDLLDMSASARWGNSGQFVESSFTPSGLRVPHDQPISANCAAAGGVPAQQSLEWSDDSCEGGSSWSGDFSDDTISLDDLPRGAADHRGIPAGFSVAELDGTSSTALHPGCTSTETVDLAVLAASGVIGDRTCGASPIELLQHVAVATVAPITCPLCGRDSEHARHRLGKHWKSLGYDGPAYCTRCASMFRAHIIRKDVSSHICSRRHPCASCLVVMQHFKPGTVEAINCRRDENLQAAANYRTSQGGAKEPKFASCPHCNMSVLKSSLGLIWRKYGYSGSPYCSACALLFRNHIIRGTKAGARRACWREEPCDVCRRILQSFGDPTGTQTPAETFALLNSKTPALRVSKGGRQAARKKKRPFNIRTVAAGSAATAVGVRDGRQQLTATGSEVHELHSLKRHRGRGVVGIGRCSVTAALVVFKSTSIPVMVAVGLALCLIGYGGLHMIFRSATQPSSSGMTYLADQSHKVDAWGAGCEDGELTANQLLSLGREDRFKFDSCCGSSTPPAWEDISISQLLRGTAAPPLLPESIDSLDGGKEEREGHTEPYHSCWKGWPMRCRSLCLGYCTTAETNHGLQHIQADDMRHDACFGPLGSTCQYYCTPMYEPVGEMRCLPGDSGYQGGLCSQKYEEGSGGSILPPRPVPDWIKQKYNASA